MKPRREIERYKYHRKVRKKSGRKTRKLRAMKEARRDFGVREFCTDDECSLTPLPPEHRLA